MNRQIARVLILTIFVGTVVGVARADVPDEWKSLDVAGLTNLAQQFRDRGSASDAGAADCKLFAGYVGDRFAADAAAGPIDWDKWLNLALYLGEYYSAETRTAMCGNIKQQFAPNADAIANIPPVWVGQMIHGVYD